MLKLEGYDVLTAVNAETALREIEDGHPDVILVDLRMPLVDGLAFLRRVRAQENHRRTPVAIVTGDYFVEETLAHELQELAASLYFKPLWLEDLLSLVQRLLLERTH
jgi:CheY-like chemotaxis protein